MAMENLERTILGRLSKAADWFVSHLTISEARSESDIELALQEIAKNAKDEELVGEGLLMARETFLDDLQYFSDNPEELEASISVPFNPPLEVGEYALLFGLYLARVGIGYMTDSLQKQHVLAAIVMADAAEAQSYWFATRGLTRCRNPDARLLRAEQVLQKRLSESFIRAEKSESARRAANVRHEKAGGSREKRETLQSIWASGKYSSRDICAEQECAALGVSYSTARRALRNTPEPT